MLNNNSPENSRFIKNLMKTQLFILFAEDYYDLNI